MYRVNKKQYNSIKSIKYKWNIRNNMHIFTTRQVTWKLSVPQNIFCKDKDCLSLRLFYHLPLLLRLRENFSILLCCTLNLLYGVHECVAFVRKEQKTSQPYLTMFIIWEGWCIFLLSRVVCVMEADTYISIMIKPPDVQCTVIRLQSFHQMRLKFHGDASQTSNSFSSSLPL